ncbi:MAG: hypothetical protein KBT87_05185 [Gammaproteobacteria bacterium]|jgi:hypothetical protein|nr:hypothetical protein [Gammaproteobacteria bacterium]MBQ0774048.1 hypothetical protein [Gammaproteobacteria bacterium]|tara:strand:- start:94210 stop:95151 length:942 start_codon:yes stop_codon:yes gene_type:complete
MLRKTKKWVGRLIDNRGAIRRDLVIALSHLNELPQSFMPGRNEPSIRSELKRSSYNNVGDVINSIGQLVLPAARESISQGTLVLRPPRIAKEEHSSRWFYINGFGSAPPVSMLNATELARVFQRPIALIHTPTWGVIRDALESITARTLRKDGKLSRPAIYVILEALKQNERVVLVCHSQGAIVASYIVRKLLRHSTTRPLVAKLEIYCIGGVSDSFEVDHELTRQAGHPVPYVEHFANGRDYFAQVGILSHLDSSCGTVFCIPERSGHLLNQHYLAGIARGDYCNRTSRLYRYTRGREPSDGDYLPGYSSEQ